MDGFVWQEILFLVGNLLNALFVVPMILHKHKPPLQSSAPIAASLSLFFVAFITMGQYVAAGSVLASDMLWFILAGQNLWQKHVGYIDKPVLPPPAPTGRLRLVFGRVFHIKTIPGKDDSHDQVNFISNDGHQHLEVTVAHRPTKPTNLAVRFPEGEYPVVADIDFDPVRYEGEPDEPEV